MKLRQIDPNSTEIMNIKNLPTEMHMMKKSVTDIAIISELEDGSKGKNWLTIGSLHIWKMA